MTFKMSVIYIISVTDCRGTRRELLLWKRTISSNCGPAPEAPVYIGQEASACLILPCLYPSPPLPGAFDQSENVTEMGY